MKNYQKPDIPKGAKPHGETKTENNPAGHFAADGLGSINELRNTINL